GGGGRERDSPRAGVPHRRACSSVVLLLVLIGLAWAGPAKTPGDTPDSVVAIGDVHGDFDDFVSILQHAGLIDAQHHWTGGIASLVLLGELLDLGTKLREVIYIDM